MTNHENRLPTYPNRVLITPESGTPYYATVTMADEPLVEGCPINKDVLDEMLSASGKVTGTKKALVLNQAGYNLTNGAVVRIQLFDTMSGVTTLNISNTGAKRVIMPNGETPDGFKANTWLTLTYSSALDSYIVSGGGSGGEISQNVNLLEEIADMKYCKVLSTDNLINPNSSWLGNAVVRWVTESEDKNYTLLAKVTVQSSLICLRKINNATNEKTDYSIPLRYKVFIQGSSTDKSYLYMYTNLIVKPVKNKENIVVVYFSCRRTQTGSSSESFMQTTLLDLDTGEVLYTTDTSNSYASGSYYYGVDTIEHLNTTTLEAYYNRTYDTIYFSYLDSSRYGVWLKYLKLSDKTTGDCIANSISSSESSTLSVFKFLDDTHVIEWYHGYSSYWFDYIYLFTFTAFNTKSSITVYNTALQSITNCVCEVIGAEFYLYAMNGYNIYTFSPITKDSTASSVTTTRKQAMNSMVTSGTLALANVHNNNLYSYHEQATDDTIDICYNETTNEVFKFEPYNKNSKYSVSVATNAEVLVNSPIISTNYNFIGEYVYHWDKYGNFIKYKFEDSDKIGEGTWVCPEDGTYKIILVGGGSAGGTNYCGGSGYLRVVSKTYNAGDTIKYRIGSGGCYVNMTNVQLYSDGFLATDTVFDDESASNANGNVGGSNGFAGTAGGGGGGYNLVTYGGNGNTTANGNGGTQYSPASGYGAGGNALNNGKDGCIVIIR